METHELLSDAFGRIKQIVHKTIDGLSKEQLASRPDGTGNSIAWLVWHLTRVQDSHMSELMNLEQTWTAGEWVEKFELSLDASETGYGMSSEQVDSVKASAELLAGYYDAVHEQTLAYLETLTAEDYAEIVDEAWDPPVTRGARLISVITDDLQHAGQAAYARGLLK